VLATGKKWQGCGEIVRTNQTCVGDSRTSWLFYVLPKYACLFCADGLKPFIVKTMHQKAKALRAGPFVSFAQSQPLAMFNESCRPDTVGSFGIGLAQASGRNMAIDD
jgi:hypothetical protein